MDWMDGIGWMGSVDDIDGLEWRTDGKYQLNGMDWMDGTDWIRWDYLITFLGC